MTDPMEVHALARRILECVQGVETTHEVLCAALNVARCAVDEARNAQLAAQARDALLTNLRRGNKS